MTAAAITATLVAVVFGLLGLFLWLGALVTCGVHAHRKGYHWALGALSGFFLWFFGHLVWFLVPPQSPPTGSASR